MEHLKIEVWGTAEKLREHGFSVYELILASARRARQIQSSRNILESKEGKMIKFPMKPINQALKEFEEEVN